MSTSQFEYSAAFDRNTGWVTQQEQSILRSKRVAIAGLGGVGGSHLLTLTRLGIGAFTVSDFDTFEIANFNRQAGASLSNLGKKKTDALLEQALDINPELDLKVFPEGVNDLNAADFLAEADLYLDSLDFFAIRARRTIFNSRFSECGLSSAPLLADSDQPGPAV